MAVLSPGLRHDQLDHIDRQYPPCSCRNNLRLRIHAAAAQKLSLSFISKGSFPLRLAVALAWGCWKFQHPYAKDRRLPQRKTHLLPSQVQCFSSGVDGRAQTCSAFKAPSDPLVALNAEQH